MLTPARRRTRWLPVLAAALIGGGLLSALPGAAEAAPATSAVQTQTDTPIDPSTAEETILVWVRNSSDKPTIPGVAGVAAEVTGPRGFTETVTTGSDGRVVVGLPRPGSYTVAVDPTTFPAGLTVPSASGTDRDVSVATGNKESPAIYLLISGDQAENTPAPGTTSTATPGTGSSSDSGDSGAGFLDRFLPRLASGLIFGLLLALASIGVSLIYGTTGLSNFAHGELVTFGGLMAFTFAGTLALPGPIAIVIATVLGGAFGWVQDAGLWRPLRRRRIALIPLMIVSIGLSLALRYLFQVIFGPGALVLPTDNSAFLRLGPIALRSSDVIGAVVCIVVLLGVAFLLLRTRIGKATRAVSDNRALAAASGIDVERVIRIVWVVSGALAGLAGALLSYYQTVRWNSGAAILLLIFAAVVLGGLGTAFGALIGSIIIGLFIDLSTLVLPANMKYVAALVAMIIILLVRPQGILGRRDRVG